MTLFGSSQALQLLPTEMYSPPSGPNPMVRFGCWPPSGRSPISRFGSPKPPSSSIGAA